MSQSAPPNPPSGRPPGGINREERRRRLRAAQTGQPVPRATVGVTHEQRRLAAEADYARRKRRNTIIVVISFLVALGLLVSLVVSAMPTPAGAATAFDVKRQTYLNKFPEGIEFTLEATSLEPIKSATLQYTVNAGDGDVGTYGRPEEFTGGTNVKATYFHSNKRYYLPPGTRVTFHWEVEDVKGNTFKTDTVKFMQDDPRFQWKSLSRNNVTVYWYAGDDAFGRSVLDTTLEAIDRLSKWMGIEYDKPMMVWTYNSKQDMDPALRPRGGSYDAQVITLGQRTTAEIMLLLGNHRQYKDTIAHETGHMVVHQLTQGPLRNVPSWLDEGLAMNAQPTVESNYFREIEQAKRRNTLMSVRAMSGVANDPQGVDLFYGQSYSVVKYLTDTYGQQKMIDLLKLLRDGTNIDRALMQVYGLDQDTLDDAWRVSIGAQPRPASERGQVDITPVAVPQIAPMTLPQSSGSNPPSGSAGAPAAGGEQGAPAVAAGGGSMLFLVGAGLIGLGILGAAAMVVQGMLRRN